MFQNAATYFSPSKSKPRDFGMTWDTPRGAGGSEFSITCQHRTLRKPEVVEKKKECYIPKAETSVSA